MTSRYYTMTDKTGNSGFLPTVTFTSGTNTFTQTQRTDQLTALGITGFYEADFASNITTISANAFLNDIKVVVVTINQVTTIGDSGFDGCSNLRAITLDCAVDGGGRYKLTSIGASAFARCSSLLNLHIPDTVKNIPATMCLSCTALQFVVMGYGWNRSADAYVTDGSIGTSAFSGCTSLLHFVVPETVGSIGDSAFASCTSMSYFAMMGLVGTVGSTVFSGAKSGSTALYTYQTGQSFTNSPLPASVTTRVYIEIVIDFNVTAAGGVKVIDFYGNTTAMNAAFTSVPNTTSAPYWKAKIKHGVNFIGTASFRAYEIGKDRYNHGIGFSFPSTLTTIGYHSFGNWINNNYLDPPCNFAAFYFPNSMNRFDKQAWATTQPFMLSNNLTYASTTKQFVFQSGANTLTIDAGQTFYNNCSYAYIIPKIVTIPIDTFANTSDSPFGYTANRLFNFFQKNAYSITTSVAGGCFYNAFPATTVINYVYLPKSLQSIGANCFGTNNTNNFTITNLYTYAYALTADGISSGSNNLWSGAINYLTTAYINSARCFITYNHYDANGTIGSGTFYVGSLPCHILFPPGVKTVTNMFNGRTEVLSVAFHHDASPIIVLQHTNAAGRGNTGTMTGTFQACTNLEFVYLNNRVTIMEPNALRNTKLNLNFDLIDAAPLREMYHAVFHTDAGYTCNISQITIPNTIKVMTSYIFGCGSTGLKPSFTKFSLADDIEFWGDFAWSPYKVTPADYGYNSADLTTSRTSVNYMTISSYFANSCDLLQSVSFLDTVDANGNAIPANGNLALERPNNSLPITIRKNKQTLTWGIKRIVNNAFQVNHRLQSIRIPDGVTHIGVNAFYEAYSLTYLYLPDSLTDAIGSAAFSYMNIGNKFGYTGLETSIRIPQSKIDDANYTSFNANNVAKYYFTVQFDRTSGKVTNGVLGRFTNQAVNAYIKYHVITLNGITGLLGGSGSTAAFDGFSSLKTVTIADTVTDIGANAFISCTGLTNIFISPKSNLTTISESGINNCTSLTSFFIPNSLKYIYAYGLFSCLSLATVTYGDNPGLKYIGANAFGGTAKALTSIFIPSSVVYIGNSAFLIGDPIAADGNLNILNTVTFGAGSRLKSIGSTCFGIGSNNMVRSGQYLRDTVLPNTVRYMGSNVFQNTHRAAHSANFVVPSSLEVIPFALLFADGGSPVDVSNVYFPLSITTVAGPRIHYGYSLDGSLPGAEFYASKSGSLIYLPSHLSAYTGRSGYVFPNYSSTEAAGRTRSFYITRSYTGNSVTTLGLSSGNPTSTTLPNSTSQIHADIQNGVVVIGSGSSIASAGGGNAVNLISVNIPSTVTTISANAFNGCSAMAYVTFSENSHLTTIGDSAFLGCTTIHDIQLPDTLTTIGANAFSGCYNLASISIPYNVTSIGAGAFNVNSSSPTTYIPRQGGYLAEQLGGNIYGEALGDYSGYSVSISSDGKILAIGANLNDATGGDAGHVRVYKYQTITDTTWSNYTVGSFSNTGTSPFNKPIVVNGGDPSPIANKYYWVQLGSDINGEGGQSGWSVSLSSDGTTVAIGALTNATTGADTGQVRVYKYQTVTDANWPNYTINSFTYTGTAPTNKPIVVNGGDANPISGKFYWVQLGVDIDGVASSQSGNSVALNSNGTVVVIGARYADILVTDGGSIRIYQYNGSTTWNPLGTTISGGSTISEQIGSSVAISDDGFTVAYGAPKYDTNGVDRGLVNIFKWNGTTWNQVGGTHIQGELGGDNCGESVSLSSDGTIVAIGAYGNDGGGAESTGHVRVFKFNGTSWNQLGQDIDGIAIYDHLGNSVSLSSDGTILAVGSRLSDTGSLVDTGLVRIYKYFNSSWQKLGPDIRGEIGYDTAGWSVSLSKDGTTVAIGAPAYDPYVTGTVADNRGHVRVYQISNFTVRLHQRLYDTIHGSFSTYFPGISPGSVQVIPALTLTNTLNPAKLTISQINNMYIRYRQSQLGCTFITVSASSGGTLTTSDVTNAISGTTGLVHLDISTNVINVEAEVCLNNLRIYSVAIPQTVTNIRFSAFNGCTNLSYLSFHPDSVCTIIATAAVHNTNIIDLALPDSLTTIGESAFQSSWRLTYACIPKNVTSMGIQPFYNCPKLTAVAVPARLNAANGTYFSIDGNAVTRTNGITFTSYSNITAIPHFKLSDYSMPNGIVQTVIDSAVKYIDHRAYAYYPDITLYAVTTNKNMQTPGPHSYTVNNVQTQILPAAFWLNGGASNNFVSNSTFPIFRSVPDLNVFSLDATAANWPDNGDDFYILMPGYSICIYNNLYDEENLFTDSPTYRYYDNEFGIESLNITITGANTTSSILIMFNGRILSKYFAS